MLKRKHSVLPAHKPEGIWDALCYVGLLSGKLQFSFIALQHTQSYSSPSCPVSFSHLFCKYLLSTYYG